jgi:LAS superfamily LD-carboxypeptidase LdcB
LAVDFWEASTKYDWDNNPKLQKYYSWLNDNAHKFGFHNTYQR